MVENFPDAGFGVYVHWPWCQSKCPYCDFNSHVAAGIDQSLWVSAYLAEIARYAAETPDRIVGSVFFGGGTPSLMQPASVAAILDAISRSWRLSNDIEITLEANPTSVEAEKFRGFRTAGVNRVSVGLQSLDDKHLKLLGRMHSAAEGLAAYDVARQVFDRVSFDLIYAKQDQSLPEWQAELSQALALGPDHLSLYQLTIEDGTAFGARHAAGRLPDLPEDDVAADMYSATQSACEAASLPAYEVSNHARPGAESRHNLVYWRGGDYVGIGPGAHGRLTIGAKRFATEAHRDPAQWLWATKTGLAESLRAALSPDDVAIEYLMMSLRLSEGCNLRRLQNVSPDLVKIQKINGLVADGMIARDADYLAATASGRIVLNAVLRELLV